MTERPAAYTPRSIWHTACVSGSLVISLCHECQLQTLPAVVLCGVGRPSAAQGCAHSL